MRGELYTRQRFGGADSFEKKLAQSDETLNKAQKEIKDLRRLTADAHISAVVQSRKAGVLSLEYSIIGGGEAERNYATEIMSKIDMQNLISDILECVLYGFAVLEINFGRDLHAREIIGRPQEYFAFDTYGNLLFVPIDNYEGTPVNKNKTVLIQNEPTYSNPYGTPTLAKCYWPAVFKQDAIKSWLICAERYGMPFIIGKHPETKDVKLDEYEDILTRLIRDGIAMLPKSYEVLILEGNRVQSVEMFERLIAYCNSEVSKAILGQTLTTEIGKTGSYAAAEVHLQVRSEIVEADGHIVTKAMNDVLRKICAPHFENNNPPHFKLHKEDFSKDTANRDIILQQLGVRFTTEYIKRNYGIEESDFTLAHPQNITAS